MCDPLQKKLIMMMKCDRFPNYGVFQIWIIHTHNSVFPVNNLATSWLLFCVLRGADWPVLHPSPHQWYLCVVLALPLLSMVPEREREIRKEVETTREREYYTNIAFQDSFWSTTVILMWQQQHNFRHSLCHVFFMLQCQWLTQKCRKRRTRLCNTTSWLHRRSTDGTLTEKHIL